MTTNKTKVTKTVRFDCEQDKDIIEWWNNQASQTNSIRRILRSVIRDSGTGDYFEAQDKLVERLKAELAGAGINDTAKPVEAPAPKQAITQTNPAPKQTNPSPNTNTTNNSAWTKPANQSANKSDDGGTDLLGIKF